MSEHRDLWCKLSDEELRMKHDELIVSMSAIDTINEELSAAKAEFKEKLREEETRKDRLVREIREKREKRPVKVEEKRDERRGQVTVERCDTGEKIETRAMTVEERQPDLPGTEDEDLDDDEGGED